MALQVVRNEVPQELQRDLVTGISSAIGGRKGLWELDITSESEANAWDVGSCSCCGTRFDQIAFG
jgi:hypothetical protein